MIRFKFVSTLFFQYGALKGTIILVLIALQCKYYTETIICIFSSGERKPIKYKHVDESDEEHCLLMQT